MQSFKRFGLYRSNLSYYSYLNPGILLLCPVMGKMKINLFRTHQCDLYNRSSKSAKKEIEEGKEITAQVTFVGLCNELC